MHSDEDGFDTSSESQSGFYDSTEESEKDEKKEAVEEDSKEEDNEGKEKEEGKNEEPPQPTPAISGIDGTEKNAVDPSVEAKGTDGILVSKRFQWVLASKHKCLN